MKKQNPLSKWFGISLITIGALALLFAFVFAGASISSDIKAEEQNKAQWDEYNAWVAQLKSMEDQVLADSLRETRTAPIIRQGGFASIFGVLFAITVCVIAAVLIAIGCFLLVRYHRMKRQELDDNNTIVTKPARKERILRACGCSALAFILLFILLVSIVLLRGCDEDNEAISETEQVDSIPQ